MTQNHNDVLDRELAGVLKEKILNAIEPTLAEKGYPVGVASALVALAEVAGALIGNCLPNHRPTARTKFLRGFDSVIDSYGGQRDGKHTH